MLTEAAIFALGWLFRALVASLLLEALIRPLARWLIKRFEIQEIMPLEHYLEQHGGKSWNCPTCQPEYRTPIDGIHQ